METAGKRQTVPAFASLFVSAQTRAAAAAGTDDQSLLWAYMWPGNSKPAKAIIADELARRGYSQEKISNWLPGSSDLAVPATLQKNMSWQDYTAAASRRAVFFRFYRTAIPFIILVLFVIGSKGEDDESAKSLGGILVLLLLTGLYICGFQFKPLALRILLLRPFGQKKMTDVLKRFVLNSIGKTGYVYTLSDRNYRPNPFLSLLGFVSDFVVLLLSPLFRNSIRVASVRSTRSFRRLERFLTKQLRPSLFAFQNGGQAFNVRCSDDWWKICVLMLMHSCEVIVIDLSMVKEGTAWELKALRDMGILSKCLFVVGEDQLTIARNRLEQEYFGDPFKPVIYTYRSSGELADDLQFQIGLRRIAFPPWQRSSS
jgi:hypothetical protein